MRRKWKRPRDAGVSRGDTIRASRSSAEIVRPQAASPAELNRPVRRFLKAPDLRTKSQHDQARESSVAGLARTRHWERPMVPLIRRSSSEVSQACLFLHHKGWLRCFANMRYLSSGILSPDRLLNFYGTRSRQYLGNVTEARRRFIKRLKRDSLFMWEYYLSARRGVKRSATAGNYITCDLY